MSDEINSPEHYTKGKIETIDLIEQRFLDFRLANAVKYLARAVYKGNEEKDTKKATWYLTRYLEKTNFKDYLKHRIKCALFSKLSYKKYIDLFDKTCPYRCAISVLCFDLWVRTRRRRIKAVISAISVIYDSRKDRGDKNND